MSTTPTERRLAITPGEARIVYNLNEAFTPHEVVCGDMTIGEFSHKDEARLHHDAHNTFNACGLTPSELLAKVKEAEELIEKLNERWDSYQDHLSRPEQ